MAGGVIKSRDRYLNFPILFLKEFMSKPDEAFTMILGYSIYYTVYSENAHFESIGDFILCSEPNTYEMDLEELGKIGEALYIGLKKKEELSGKKIPIVGISVDLFNDFYRVEKSDFDLVCLLAFLAIKSILQKSEYRNIKNTLLLARMGGCPSPGHPIPEEISYWMLSSRYRRAKVIDCLRDRYKMKTAFKSRGITCSFSLSQEDLEYSIQLAKVKKVNKGNSDRKLAKEKALQRIKSRSDY
jgi:hypothetical protein